MSLLRKHRDDIDRAEKICVLEAQQTAQLLNNVENERDLVHDFPWWQMISCLICASSILLVADAFLLSDGDESLSTFPRHFGEDAENCLKVFEALNVDSGAAQKAKDTLKQMSEWRRRVTGMKSLPVSEHES